MTRALLFDVTGPKYLRFAREATPVVTDKETPFEFGRANIYRFRGEQERFSEAFSVALASEYRGEDEDITMISCGPELAEALRAAYILKMEHGLETRVINMHTVKPLDREAIRSAGRETRAVLTAEEHQVGGLGNLVAAVLMQDKDRNPACRFGMTGVKDRFGESGKPWQLMRHFELSAEFIAYEAYTLLQS